MRRRGRHRVPPSVITVNGRTHYAGGVTIILDSSVRGRLAVRAAEQLIMDVTGRRPYRWREPDGGQVIGTSPVPAH